MKCLHSTLLILFAIVISINMGSSQDQMFDVCPLKVGEKIPAVTITNIDGEQDSLVHVASKPSVIVFYRGAWCGYCTQHLAELNDIKADIDSLGYNIFGITIDQPSKLDISLEKANAEIDVYSDSGLDAVSAFGLDWNVGEMYDKYKNKYDLDLEAWSGEKHHSLPVPAIFIIKEGIIQFQYVNPNYSVRLNPNTLLAILESMQ